MRGTYSRPGMPTDWRVKEQMLQTLVHIKWEKCRGQIQLINQEWDRNGMGMGLGMGGQQTRSEKGNQDQNSSSLSHVKSTLIEIYISFFQQSFFLFFNFFYLLHFTYRLINHKAYNTHPSFQRYRMRKPYCIQSLFFFSKQFPFRKAYFLSSMSQGIICLTISPYQGWKQLLTYEQLKAKIPPYILRTLPDKQKQLFVIQTLFIQ